MARNHYQFASGLGTFGICDGLITPRGNAMCCRSVVAHIQIPPTKRPYHDLHVYCLFFAKGSCAECIRRCTAGAITREGHNKEKCKNYMHLMIEDYVRSNYDFEGFGYRRCQTGVPCESEIPK